MGTPNTTAKIAMPTNGFSSSAQPHESIAHPSPQDAGF
jgi:hypothetical protein